MHLHHTKIGETGSVIVILHGLFGNGRNWQNIATYLAEKKQVYRLDIRNHGLSPHTDNMTYANMAGDVLDFIKIHQLGKVSLIGHSMGGKIAMYLALTSPQVVEQLVVVDIAPVSYTHRFSKIFTALLALPLNKIKSRKEAENILSKHIADKAIRQFLLQNLCLATKVNDGHNQSQSPVSMTEKSQRNFWRFNLDALYKNIAQISAFPVMDKNTVFKGNTLFLAGNNSDYINENNRKPIKNFFPRSNIVTVKGAGHWLHAEKPEPLKNILSSFFRFNNP